MIRNHCEVLGNRTKSSRRLRSVNGRPGLSISSKRMDPFSIRSYRSFPFVLLFSNRFPDLPRLCFSPKPPPVFRYFRLNPRLAGSCKIFQNVSMLIVSMPKTMATCTRAKRQKKRPKRLPIFVFSSNLIISPLADHQAARAIFSSKAPSGKAAPFPNPVITARQIFRIS